MQSEEANGTSEDVSDSETSTRQLNGNRHFLSTEIDEIDCKSDCIYKEDDEDKTEEDEECDVFNVRPPPPPLPDSDEVDVEAPALNVIVNDKTDLVKDLLMDFEANGKFAGLKDAGAFESICLRSRNGAAGNGSGSGRAGGDINHNEDATLKAVVDEFDSDTECTTEPSESRSENTVVCDGGTMSRVRENGAVDVLKSVETSTETLVSENVVCG